MAITCPKACDMCAAQTAAPSSNDTNTSPVQTPTLHTTSAPTMAGGSLTNPPTTSATGSSCIDKQDECSFWADSGECQSNPAFMTPNCPESCGLCEFGGGGGGSGGGGGNETDCKDDRQECVGWANAGECENNPAFMSQNCQLSCGICTGTGGGGGDTEQPQVCEDKDESCGTWANAGECGKNPSYMLANCPKSCDGCPGNEGSSNAGVVDPSCEDDRDECQGWANAGECNNNQAFMNQNCKASCGLC
jgi:ShK domain-like